MYNGREMRLVIKCQRQDEALPLATVQHTIPAIFVRRYEGNDTLLLSNHQFKMSTAVSRPRVTNGDMSCGNECEVTSFHISMM